MNMLEFAHARPFARRNKKYWVAALCARDLRRAEEVAEEMCDQDYVVHNPKLPDYGRGPAAAKDHLL